MSWLTKGFLLLLTICAALPVRADAVDDLIRAQMQVYQVPGAAVAVIRNGAIEKIAAYGVASVEQGSPVTPASAFQIASGTKTFTGILLGHLVEQGRLDLDAPVSRYLPDVPAAWDGMTVRHLANHTAGFAMGPPGNANETTEQAYAAIRARALATRPGEREQYAVDDFVLLGLVLEKAGGKPYAALLDDVIVRPLGLRHTRFENAVGEKQGGLNKAEVVPGRVSTYSLQGGRQTLYWFLYPPATYPAGGLFSSIGDMAAVLLALDRGTLLGPRGKAAMWETASLADGRRGQFASGWVTGTLRGHAMVGHSGGPALADILYVPSQRVGVIVLTNQRTLYPNLARAIAAGLVPQGELAAKPIADTDPRLTARLLGVARALGAGVAAEAEFSGAARKDLAQHNEWLGRRLGVLGAPQRLELLAEGPQRAYRAWYADGESRRWRFRLDGAGLIAGVDVDDE